MKFIKSLLSSLAVLGMTYQLTAQEAAPAEAIAAEAAPAEAAVAEAAMPTFEALVSFVPEIVATRKGETALTREELFQGMKPQIEMALKQGIPLTEEMVQAFAYQHAQQLVVRNVVLEAAQAAGCTADMAKAKEMLEDLKKQSEEQQPGLFAMQLAEYGLTEDKLLEQFCEQQIFEQYQEKVLANVEKPAPATEEEAQKFYEENPEYWKQPELLSASHILVQFPSQSPTDDEKAAALKKAQEIRATLAEDGSNFAEVAAVQSDCPSSEQGGYLDQFPRGAMVREFEDALLKLKEGEISDPVETIFGYHIIKAGATQPESTTSFEEVKEDIMAFLNQSKERSAVGETMGNVIEKLMEDVEILLPQPQMEDDFEEEEPEAEEAAKPEEPAEEPAEAE